MGATRTNEIIQGGYLFNTKILTWSYLKGIQI